MCLRFVFLMVTRLVAWSWLFRREESWKDAEILLLRHQLAVLRRLLGSITLSGSLSCEVAAGLVAVMLPVRTR